MAATNDRSGLGSGRDLRLCQHGRHQPSTSTCSVWARLARLCLSTNTVVISAQACFDCDAIAGATGWPLIERDWLRALSICRCDQQGRASRLRMRCERSCWRASAAARRNALALLSMPLACLLTRGTGGRSLPTSSCYMGSAGSRLRSEHGVISPRPARPFSSHFGRTAARTAPYRVCQWLWLSAGHCSTAQRCVLCDCGL